MQQTGTKQDAGTKSGKPVVKPMVRVAENTSENSKVDEVDKNWEGVTTDGQKESYKKRKILSRTLRTWIIVVK
ncbi:hypothetical protein HYE10_03725 [Mycoplasmopsis bovis]|nr:hypothetical protein HYE10_03725 [Mycoplasmopsis bovis]